MNPPPTTRMIRATNDDGGDRTRRIILAFARKIGIQLNYRRRRKDKLGRPRRQGFYGWDGRTLAAARETINNRDLLHDIAHWIVCSPRRRALPEFGLGPGFRTDTPPGADDPLEAEQRFCPVDNRMASIDEEEKLASFLGICLEAWFGIDPLFTAFDHGWRQIGPLHADGTYDHDGANGPLADWLTVDAFETTVLLEGRGFLEQGRPSRSLLSGTIHVAANWPWEQAS
jgi:hypothetical protein